MHAGLCLVVLLLVTSAVQLLGRTVRVYGSLFTLYRLSLEDPDLQDALGCFFCHIKHYVPYKVTLPTHHAYVAPKCPAL